MNAKLPETFGLDRLQTPIGTALLVTDTDGVLRALDWQEYESRMRELLRLQCGAVALKDARSPAALRSALAGYFKGHLDRLKEIEWRVGGTPFQRKVWGALPGIPLQLANRTNVQNVNTARSRLASGRLTNFGRK